MLLLLLLHRGYVNLLSLQCNELRGHELGRLKLDRLLLQCCGRG